VINKEKVYEILSEILKLDIKLISEDKKADDFDSWDSLATINIALALEAEFDLTLSIEQISSINSISNILKITEN
jgi:acyl carrier protein